MPPPAEPLRLQVEAVPVAEAFGRWHAAPSAGLGSRISSARMSRRQSSGRRAATPREEKLELRFGHNELYLPMPEVEQNTTVEVALNAGGKELKATHGDAADPQMARVHRSDGPHGHRLHGRAGAGQRPATPTIRCRRWRWSTSIPRSTGISRPTGSSTAFLRAHPEKAEETFRRLREGRMGLSAFFGNMLTGLCSHEALNRATLLLPQPRQPGRVRFHVGHSR